MRDEYHNYCPECGHVLLQDQYGKWFCQHCGFEAFDDAADLLECVRCHEKYQVNGIHHFDTKFCPGCKRARAKVLDPVFFAIHGAMTELNSEYERADLAGVEVITTYDDLEKVLTDGLEYLRSVRGHAHQWNDDGYCDVCGADGRA